MMQKITAIWNGWGGGPGYTAFYFGEHGDITQLNNAAARVRAFFFSLAACIPTPISVTIAPTSLEIIEGSGEIVDEIALGVVPAPVAGAGGTTFSSVSGACVIWRTASHVNGRLLRGKSYIVPMSSTCYDTDGSLLATRLTELRNAATVLATPGGVPATDLVVWHRPTAGAGGSFATVTTASVKDQAAVLRSRRA